MFKQLPRKAYTNERKEGGRGKYFHTEIQQREKLKDNDCEAKHASLQTLLIGDLNLEKVRIITCFEIRTNLLNSATKHVSAISTVCVTNQTMPLALYVCTHV